MIGVAVITHQRPDYYSKAFSALQKHSQNVDRIITVASGNRKGYKFTGEVIKNDKKTWVAVNKNLALKALMDCDHIFIMEDDIIIKKDGVFNRYIQASELSGLHHLNFALHGPLNKGGYEYQDGNVAYYKHIVGAFSYYTKECLDVCGYFDENFKNAWEHVEHTKRIGDMGYTSPFAAFADIVDASDYLTEIPESINNSTIRLNPDWKKNIDDGFEYFKKIDPTITMVMK
jgi:GT2 family glycosyltransferase